MMSKFFLAIFGLLLLDGSHFVASEPTWTSLRVTFGLNVFSSRTFAKLPRTESRARVKEYSKLPGECGEGKFLGHRYMKGEDPTVIIIYDVNGYIAGLQHGIPKSDVDGARNRSYSHISAYQLDVIDERLVYLLTAYFVDPTIICNVGRSFDEYDEEGTGTGLYFQNGTHPLRDTVHVPLYEEGTNLTRWVRGECKRGIGVHYWHDYSEHMDCNNFFPFSMIYNRGKITSFAFVNFGFYEFSSRFEHPSKDSLSDYMSEPIPQCIENEFDTSGGLSNMHVFFSVRPWNILC